MVNLGYESGKVTIKVAHTACSGQTIPPSGLARSKEPVPLPVSLSLAGQIFRDAQGYTLLALRQIMC